VLQIRQLDVRHHPPLKSAHESCFEAGNLGGRSIAGQYDLTTGLVQGVEGVEELFLGGLLALQELHVVDEKEVGLAESTTELVRGAVLNRGDELVGELLGADEGDAGVGLPLEELVRDGLHEVGLADPGIAIDEQRVVDARRRLGNRVRRSGGELVGLSDHEIAECVSIA